MKISVLFLMLVIISGMSLIGINQAFALACQSNVAGTWNAPSTWSNCGGGVPDDTGDTVDIFDSGDVQLNNDFVVGSLNVVEGGSLSINAKLTAQPLFVQATSNIFINCNGELVLTEGGSNEGLITNHGILRTITGANFLNPGTYQSSGGDFFVGPFIGNDIEPIPSICVVVGGNLVPIDSSALILAGAQTNAVWIMSALAVIGSVAFGALYITSKKN